MTIDLWDGERTVEEEKANKVMAVVIRSMESEGVLPDCAEKWLRTHYVACLRPNKVSSWLRKTLGMDPSETNQYHFVVMSVPDIQDEVSR